MRWSWVTRHAHRIVVHGFGHLGARHQAQLPQLGVGRRSTAPSDRRVPLPASRSIPSDRDSVPPWSLGLSLPEPCPMISCRAVIRSEASSPYFLANRDLLGGGGELFQCAESAGLPQRPRAARKKEALAAVLFADFVFVGQVVAHRADVEIAGLDHGLHRLGQRRLHSLLLVLRQPGSVVLEILGIGRPASPSVGSASGR